MVAFWFIYIAILYIELSSYLSVILFMAVISSLLIKYGVVFVSFFVEHRTSNTNFYCRANFDYFDKSQSNELTFRKGEIFNVRDTMYQGLIGAWQAKRVGRNGRLLDQGILPNKSRYLIWIILMFSACTLYQNGSVGIWSEGPKLNFWAE